MSRAAGWFRRHALLVALLIASSLLFARPLVRGETFISRDLVSQYYPRERLLARSGGSAWNPHLFLGMPLDGDQQTARYEPLRALSRRAGWTEATGLVVYLWFYFLIATAGVYCFALRHGASPLGAGFATLACVWGGAYVVRFGHPWLFGGMALLPWVALTTERLLERRRIADALWVALPLGWTGFIGHPQPLFMLLLFVPGYLALGVLSVSPGERRAVIAVLSGRLTVAAVALGLLLSAAYAPVLDVLGHCRRQELGGLGFSGSYSFHPWDWARLLAPDLYGNDMRGTHFGSSNYTEQTCYLGVAPLLLFGLALAWPPRERRLIVVAFGAFLLACGRYTPLFYACYALVPGFRLFRCPCRFSWFFVLAAATVSARVLTRIANGDRPPTPTVIAARLRRLWLPAALLFATVAAGAGPWIDRYTEIGAHLTMRSASVRAALLLTFVGVVLECWLRSHLSGRRAAWLLFAATFCDLGMQWLPYQRTRPLAEVSPPPEVERVLARAGEARVMILGDRADGDDLETTALLNWGEAAGYDGVRGYSQLVESDLLALLARGDVGGGAPADQYATARVDPAEWLLDLLGVRYLVQPRAGASRFGSLPLVIATGRFEVRERPGYLPRAWLVGGAAVVDDSTALERLPTLPARARALALVDRDVGLGADPRPVGGSVRFVKRAADEVLLEVAASDPALLVLADRGHRGWRASIDDTPVPIVRADYLFRGVRIEAGRHRVRFTYLRPGHGWAGLVSLLTLAAIAVVLLGAARRDRSARI